MPIPLWQLYVGVACIFALYYLPEGPAYLRRKPVHRAIQAFVVAVVPFILGSVWPIILVMRIVGALRECQKFARGDCV